MNCVFFYFLTAIEFLRPRSNNEVMSYAAPIVIHDSDSESDLVSAQGVGSTWVARADLAHSPQLVADLATASAADSAPCTLQRLWLTSHFFEASYSILIQKQKQRMTSKLLLASKQ